MKRGVWIAMSLLLVIACNSILFFFNYNDYCNHDKYVSNHHNHDKYDLYNYFYRSNIYGVRDSYNYINYYLTGNWWDSLGIPTYGGTLTISLPTDITGWDDYSDSGMTSIIPAYEEALTTDDWTLNPSVFAYQLSYRSSNYEVGYLGSSWEFTNPQTYVVHLPKMFTGKIYLLQMAPNLPLLMWFGILTGYLVWVMGLLHPARITLRVLPPLLT